MASNAPTQRERSRALPPWMDKGARYSASLLLMLALLGVVAYAAAHLLLVVVPLLLAALIACTLYVPAHWLTKHRVPKSLAAIALVFGLLGLLGGVFAIVIPMITEEVAASGPKIVEEGKALLRRIVEQTPLSWGDVDRASDAAVERAKESGGQIASGVFTGALLATELLVGALLTVVLTFFFVRDGKDLAAWFVERAPQRRRATYRAMLERAAVTARGYLKGMSITASANALGLGLGLWIIGVPLVLPLMALTFVATFVPILGATVAGLLACLVALVSLGVTEALLVLAVVVVVQQLEGNVLEPFVVGRVLTLHPVVIMVALSAGTIVGGIAGAFLAVPITAVAVTSLQAGRRHQKRHGGAARTDTVGAGDPLRFHEAPEVDTPGEERPVEH